MNPFLDMSSLPRFGELSPKMVAAATDEMMRRSQAAADKAAAATTISWESIGEPLAHADEQFTRFWSQVEHLHAVMNDAEWQKAHRENLPKVAAHFARLGQHPGLHRQWKKLWRRRAALSATRKKITADALLAFKLSGADLPPPQQKRFRNNSEQLAQLSARFVQNVLDADNAFVLPVKDESALGQMPDDLRAAARADGGKNHPFAITLKAPSYLAFMRYSPVRELREKLYRAYCTRASEFGDAGRDNTKVINAIMRLRQKQSQMLGYDNYCKMALSRRMAKTPQQVGKFLRELAKRARPFAEREVAELRAFAKAELGIGDLRPWDVPFASELLRRQKFDFAESDMRPYLQEERVINGLFGCARQLFGIGAKACQPPAPSSLWTKDARLFRLSRKEGGFLYLDPYSRQSKRGGAWMAEARCRAVFGDMLQLPAAHIVCNFRRPAKGQKALLNWDEAVTLFHEFGHALHHLLTEVNDYEASGINGVEWDAVELPSQFMENFIWHWPLLRKMTAHAKTGAPMPKSLYDKALAARRFQSGMMLMRQLEFALFDWFLHEGGRTTKAALNEARKITQIIPAPDYNRFPCAFGHIFGGGYAAGYYSYLWAEALAADAFAAFAEVSNKSQSENGNKSQSQSRGKTQSQQWRELGERFRREILAKGGSRPAAKNFQAFRTRPPSMSPLLAHYGLK